jgi:excisionase family DNA binding protein
MNQTTNNIIIERLDALEESIRIYNLGKKEFLNIKETCAYFNTTVNHLYGLTRGKKVPYYKPNGKTVYFKIEDLENWIKNSKVNTENGIDELTSNFLASYKK